MRVQGNTESAHMICGHFLCGDVNRVAEVILRIIWSLGGPDNIISHSPPNEVRRSSPFGSLSFKQNNGVVGVFDCLDTLHPTPHRIADPNGSTYLKAPENERTALLEIDIIGHDCILIKRNGRPVKRLVQEIRREDLPSPTCPSTVRSGPSNLHSRASGQYERAHTTRLCLWATERIGLLRAEPRRVAEC